MGTCNSNNLRQIKTDSGKAAYPQYYQEVGLIKKKKDNINDNQNWTHYQDFKSNQNEIKQRNPALYSLGFDESHAQDIELSISDLTHEDEERFYFFVNKRPYETIHIRNSQILFPRFSLQYYPNYNNGLSKITKITGTSSQIMLDEQSLYYSFLEKLTYLDLSFDNIEALPESFNKLKELKFLSLRRNVGQSLPFSFRELRNIVHLDLSGNQFRELPKELSFNSRGEILNMNNNLGESFDIGGFATSAGQFVFIAQNRGTQFPMELKMFSNIKLINIDDNQIPDIDLKVILEAFPKGTQITMNKNNGKEDNEIDYLNHTKTSTNSEDEDNSEGQKKVIIPKTQLLKKGKTGQTEAYKNGEKLRGKNRSTKIEQALAEKVDEFINDQISQGILESNAIETVKNQQHLYMLEMLDNIISMKKESEITYGESSELKALFNKLYSTIVRKKDVITGNLKQDEIDKLEPIEKEFIIDAIMKLKKEKNLTTDEFGDSKGELLKDNKKKEDKSNIIFLKDLNKLLTSNYVIKYGHYGHNINENIYSLVGYNLQTKDKVTCMLLLTELKIFISDLIKFYESTTSHKTIRGVVYETIKSKAKNVIRDIFFEDSFVKILYQIGLKSREPLKVNDGIEQFMFKFLINSQTNETLNLLENYLIRFLEILKRTKLDIEDLMQFN